MLKFSNNIFSKEHKFVKQLNLLFDRVLKLPLYYDIYLTFFCWLDGVPVFLSVFRWLVDVGIIMW